MLVRRIIVVLQRQQCILLRTSRPPLTTLTDEEHGKDRYQHQAEKNR